MCIYTKYLNYFLEGFWAKFQWIYTKYSYEKCIVYCTTAYTVKMNDYN